MLLKITNKCRMECIHCGENSHKNGKHMDKRTFYKSLSFIKKCNPKILFVTGGEPLEHPQFFEYCEIIKKKLPTTKFLLISNGMFLNDASLKKRLFNNNIFEIIQVTNDSRYYPIKIKDPNHPKIKYFNKIVCDKLINFGRAKNLNDEKIINPQCFNTRQIFKINYNAYKNQKYNCVILHNFISDLERKLFKFCSPSIDINGEIHPSEWAECGCIGTVFEPVSRIIYNFKNFKCNRCKLFNNLSTYARQQLGE